MKEDWQYILDREGLLKALPTIRAEFARLFYCHLRFMVISRRLDDPFPEFIPGTQLEIRLFERADLELVREINCPSEARQCERRLDRGHKGLAALIQGNLAGYAWGYTELHHTLERIHIDLEPGDVLFNDAFTNPAYRGQGVQTALTSERFRTFRDLGYKRAICYIEENNASSLAVWQRKLGGQTVGKVDYIRVGPWYRIRYS